MIDEVTAGASPRSAMRTLESHHGYAFDSPDLGNFHTQHPGHPVAIHHGYKFHHSDEEGHYYSHKSDTHKALTLHYNNTFTHHDPDNKADVSKLHYYLGHLHGHHE